MSNNNIESIAVMPFVNESGNADLDFLSDGLTESVIGRLSEIPNLSVKARSTVFRYKDKNVAIQTIGRELSVPAVITGNLKQRDDGLLLHVELVDCRSETVIWHGDYDRPRSAVVTIAGEIARDVAKSVSAILSGGVERRIVKDYTQSSTAYELYLKGRFYWDKRSPESFAMAENSYKQAIALDPKYALAYAGLADLYIFSGPEADRRISMNQAREYAHKALDIDESLAEAHTTLGFVNENFDFDMSAAEQEFRRAIQLKPNYAVAHQFFGGFLVQTGHTDEGLTEVRRAVELEPYSAAINWHLGSMLIFARRYDEAIQQQEKTLQMHPNYALSEISLAKAYLLAGRPNEAAELIQKHIQGNGSDQNWQAIACIAAASQDRPKCMGILSRILNETPSKNLNGYLVASVYVSLGDNDRAIEWLNRGYEQRAFQMFFLRVDPVFDNLHGDQRYQDLLRRMDLQK